MYVLQTELVDKPRDSWASVARFFSDVRSFFCRICWSV